MSDENGVKNVFLPVVKLETMVKNYLNSVNLKNENRMFKSGFAWVKVNGYSYICKIVERNEDDTLFTVELDNCTFTDVPVTALTPLRGDE